MIPIVRIKGLPLSAKTRDIRALFSGLIIPDGAVHIIGGAEGIAFVAFATFDDAKKAVMCLHAEIHGCHLNVEWSSDTEMYEAISGLLRARNEGIFTDGSCSHSSVAVEHSTEHIAESVNTLLPMEGSEISQSLQREAVTESDAAHFLDRSSYVVPTSQYDLHNYVSLINFTQQSNDSVRRGDGVFCQPLNVYKTINSENVLPISSVSVQSTLPSTMPGSSVSREVNEKQKFYYIKLTNIPSEMSTTAALEDFLHPSVPLRLSSVKTIFDQNRFPYCFLVRLENVDDMQSALNKDGEKKIRIQACSQVYFTKAVDGSIKRTKVDETKLDGDSSDEDVLLPGSNSSSYSKKVVCQKSRNVDRKLRKNSPQIMTKRSESRRVEKRRSPSLRRSEVASSRKRKEYYSSHGRFSPSDERSQKYSPKRFDRSSKQSRTTDSDRRQERSRSPSYKNQRNVMVDRERYTSTITKSVKNDAANEWQQSIASPTVKIFGNEKMTNDATMEAATTCRPVSVRRQSCLSTEEVHGSNSSMDLDGSSDGLSDGSEFLKNDVFEGSPSVEKTQAENFQDDPFSSQGTQPVMEMAKYGCVENVTTQKKPDATKSTYSEKAGERYCVEFTNLPLSVTEDEVKDYLGSLSGNATVRRACFRDGKPSDRWIAVFESKDLVEKASHIHGEIQGQIIVPRKLVEHEAALLLDGSKPVASNLKDSSVSKIKFSIGKDKQYMKLKQEKGEMNGKGKADEHGSSLPTKIESEEVLNEDVSTACKDATSTSDMAFSYEGGQMYGSRNEQLWYLYNQYCQTYYAAVNGPLDYMQTGIHGSHGGRGRPVLLPNGPAEFYQYPGNAYPLPTAPDAGNSDQVSFFGAVVPKFVQRPVPGRFRTPTTYSANPLLYKRRGAGGYQAKGLLNEEKTSTGVETRTSGLQSTLPKKEPAKAVIAFCAL